MTSSYFIWTYLCYEIWMCSIMQCICNVSEFFHLLIFKMFCCSHLLQQSIIQNKKLFYLNMNFSVVEMYFNVHTYFVFLYICLHIQCHPFADFIAHVRFGVLTVVSLKIQIFWVIMVCCWVSGLHPRVEDTSIVWKVRN
jgi:hypothetical protein